MEIEEKTLVSHIEYECPVFTVTKDIARLPNGLPVTRARILHNGGSGILPLTEGGSVLLVEQFRYGIGQTTLEIPAGKLEKGEDPLACAKRELAEEAGADSAHIVPLGRLAVSPAYDSEIIYLYLADELSFHHQKLDDDEFLNVRKLPFAKALDMVLSGELTDAKTQIALLKAKALLGL